MAMTTKEMRHTAGPWATSGHDTLWVVLDLDGRPLGTVRKDHPNGAANARLIAAAPDLFAVAKAIDEMWSDGGEANPIDARSGTVREIWTALRAALSRAQVLS